MTQILKAIKIWFILNIDKISEELIDYHALVVANKRTNWIYCLFDNDLKSSMMAIATIDAAAKKYLLEILVKGKTLRSDQNREVAKDYLN
jgi:hypothetical protein